MEDPLKYSDVTGKVIGIFFEVYNELGHGFLESVYQSAIQIAFAERGIANVGKIEIPVWFRGHKVGDFEADLLVENCVLLELKAVRQLDSAHQAQLLNYLRATDLEVGLLLNFGIKPQFKRMCFDNSRKKRDQQLDSLAALLLPNPDETG